MFFYLVGSFLFVLFTFSVPIISFFFLLFFLPVKYCHIEPQSNGTEYTAKKKNKQQQSYIGDSKIIKCTKQMLYKNDDANDNIYFLLYLYKPEKIFTSFTALLVEKDYLT